MNICVNDKDGRMCSVISRAITLFLCLAFLLLLGVAPALADDTVVVVGGTQTVNGGFTTAGSSVSGNPISQPVGVVIGGENATNGIEPNAGSQQTIVNNGNSGTMVVVSDGVKTSTVTASTTASNVDNSNVATSIKPNAKTQTALVPDTSLTITTSSVSGLRSQIFEMTNAFRIENGLSVLAYNDDLQSAANTRAQESAVQFNHVRPDGTEAYTVVTVDYNITGENLIQAENSIATANTLMETWKNSGTHRMNLLHPSYTSMAVGIYQENGMTFVSQVFIG